MSTVYEIKTRDDIEKVMSSGYKNVIIDHYADWCSPCKYLTPHYEKLAQDFSSRETLFCKCDSSTKLFPIQSLPTIEFYVNGNKYKEVQGANLDEISRYIREVCIEPVTRQQPSRPPQQQPSRTPQQPSTPYSTGNAISGSKKGGGYRSYGKL